MAINNELILKWIDHVAHIQGLSMDPVALADDVMLMAYVFTDEHDFKRAMINVVRAIQQLMDGKVEPSQLKQDYSDWFSYHFQSIRAQGRKADLRIVFQINSDHSMMVKGFGHRHIPHDIYKRLRPR